MKALITVFISLFSTICFTQNYLYLKANRLFDGETVSENKGILIKDNKIETLDFQSVIEKDLPQGTRVIDLKNATLLPG